MDEWALFAGAAVVGFGALWLMDQSQTVTFHTGNPPVKKKGKPRGKPFGPSNPPPPGAKGTGGAMHKRPHAPPKTSVITKGTIQAVTHKTITSIATHTGSTKKTHGIIRASTPQQSIASGAKNAANALGWALSKSMGAQKKIAQPPPKPKPTLTSRFKLPSYYDNKLKNIAERNTGSTNKPSSALKAGQTKSLRNMIKQGTVASPNIMTKNTATAAQNKAAARQTTIEGIMRWYRENPNNMRKRLPANSIFTQAEMDNMQKEAGVRVHTEAVVNQWIKDNKLKPGPVKPSATGPSAPLLTQDRAGAPSVIHPITGSPMQNVTRVNQTRVAPEWALATPNKQPPGHSFDTTHAVTQKSPIDAFTEWISNGLKSIGDAFTPRPIEQPIEVP